MTKSIKLLLLATAGNLALALPALAQTAQPATPPQEPVTQGSAGAAGDATGRAAAANPVQASTNAPRSDDTGLQDIVVTATRRSVNLQSVPAVVTALPASTLKTYNITGVLQLPTLTSGLVIAPSGGNNLYLRGIGSASSGYNEAQVAVYVDGIYLANPAMGIYSFNNIDQIEVLKGPQGTLYGRNVTGGLISVTTRNPGTEFRLDASAGYANYNTFTTNVYLSAPLTDNLAANFALFHQKQSTGWTKNIYTGNTEQKSDETGVESKLQWRPGTTTKITGSFIYDYNNRDYGYAYETAPARAFLNPPTPNYVGSDGTPYLGKYRDALPADPSAPFHAYIGALKIEQDVNFANLMSLTAYQTSHTNLFFTGGLQVTGLPINGESAALDPFYERNKTFSQEFQLTSKPSQSRLDWILGAFYYNDHEELQLDSYNTCSGGGVGNALPCAPGIPSRNIGFPTTYSISGYADGTYRFFTATKLTVGLRYTSETKGLSGIQVPLQGRPNSIAAYPAAGSGLAGQQCSFTIIIAGCTPTQIGQLSALAPNGIPSRLHFDKLTYRFVLAQDVGDDLHLYATHNLGFKSGAFNGNAFNNPPVQPELLYDTEVGFKSELLDRKLRFNAAYFHYTYKNVQVRSQPSFALPGNAILLNAARELMNGVDVDFSFTPVHGLVFTGSAEYDHAVYAPFPGTMLTNPITTMVNGVLVGRVNSILNYTLSGYDVQRAPPFSASVGASYTLDLNSGAYTLSANDHYTSRTALIQDGTLSDPPHHLVDMSLSWTALNKRYDINLFVRNLTNAYVYAAVTESSNYAVVPGAPRTFGGTFGVHF